MSLILTKAGLNAYAQAEVTGTKLQATHMATGDGNGQSVSHTSQSTELAHETWRGSLQRIEITASGEVEFEGHVPLTVGGWYIREVAIYAGEVLLAIGSHPEVWKPDPEAPEKVELVITAPVKFDNAAIINLTVDTTKVLASQEMVVGTVAQHNEDNNAHAGALSTLKDHPADPNAHELLFQAMAQAIANHTSAEDAHAALFQAIINQLPGNASTTGKGLVELATLTETLAGTDAARAVSPKGLAAALAGKAAINHSHDIAPLRQAIIACSTDVNGLPNFLTINGDGVTVQAAADPLVLSIADGEKDYVERINTDRLIPSNNLGEGDNYIYAERAEDGSVILGTTQDRPVYNTTGLAETLDLFAPANGYVWPGVGIISASTEWDNNNGAWKAFSQRWYSANYDDWSATAKSGTLKVVFDKTRKLTGYAIIGTPLTYTSRKEPKTWNFKVGTGDTPDTVVDSQTDQTGWTAGERRNFMFASPVDAKSFEIDVTACNGTNLMIAELIPIFEPDWSFDPTLYKGTSQRIYLGKAVVSGGTMIEVYPYAPGIYAVRDVNGGANITTNSRYVELNPFGQGVPANVVAEIYHNGVWANTSFSQTTKGYGTFASTVRGAVVVQTGDGAVSTVSNKAGGGHGSNDTACFALCRITIGRTF
ncbi:hypothetical protein GO013_02480 [Pseudodesulfovibrio sp. JC047]|uniref:phage tail-collar fiber domain-containing protein n=1 Tax=Pseudodesulfovibrio sp. JC047 TaxID=2683199 RepID=UPI0013D28EC1|nr:phage tail protein [Pseudodesulfovibrio sp. JC047]NDV18282.1 hypothetical protein [Pseudodesulfovibrio sp. JC047]